MIACENCGEEFHSLQSHVEHGGAFRCCKRQRDKLAAHVDALLRTRDIAKAEYVEAETRMFAMQDERDAAELRVEALTQRAEAAELLLRQAQGDLVHAQRMIDQRSERIDAQAEQIARLRGFAQMLATTTIATGSLDDALLMLSQWRDAASMVLSDAAAATPGDENCCTCRATGVGLTGCECVCHLKPQQPTEPDARDRETLDDVQRWVSEMFSASNLDGRVAKLKEELAELERTGHTSVEEMADVAIVLCHLADRQGMSLWAAIRAKHARNQARTWEMNERGCFSHVDATPPEPPAADCATCGHSVELHMSQPGTFCHDCQCEQYVSAAAGHDDE